MTVAIMLPCKRCITVLSSYFYWFERVYILKDCTESSGSDVILVYFSLLQNFVVFSCHERCSSHEYIVFLWSSPSKETCKSAGEWLLPLSFRSYWAPR